jgi:hypothetical protein
MAMVIAMQIKAWVWRIKNVRQAPVGYSMVALELEIEILQK